MSDSDVSVDNDDQKSKKPDSDIRVDNDEQKSKKPDSDVSVGNDEQKSMKLKIVHDSDSPVVEMIDQMSEEIDHDHDSVIRIMPVVDQMSKERLHYLLHEKPYCPKGVMKKDHECWAKYSKQVKESEGFDIQDFPGVCAMTTVVPCTKFKEYPHEHEILIYCAAMAIKEYNEKENEDYQDVQIEKANAAMQGTGISYYVTFKAMNSKKEMRSFQGQVFKGIYEERVQLIRLRKPPQ